MSKLKVGAVIYDPKVTVIWSIISDFFKQENFEIEPVYFKDYASQVDALEKEEIDVAWNSPLAWLDSHLRFSGKELNGAMRDTDNDRCTYLVVRKKDEIKDIADLKGKSIGFGAIDSPQARLIPINFLHENGLEFGKDYTEKRFDVGVGLHGDHVGGELDSLKALLNDEVDATFMLDLNYEKWINDGTLDKNYVDVLAKTPLFDHCIFTGRPSLEKERFDKFNSTLDKMEYSNPDHKEMMDMEGLKKWVPARTSGFEQLKKANEYLGFFDKKGN